MTFFAQPGVEQLLGWLGGQGGITPRFGRLRSALDDGGPQGGQLE
jgi:hypothetical protein